ncbi:hypothetical protein [Azohydromonas australica]|uniref:hypothetical protein n=1 Tax=Azohydromonas australica TaxID=364039 RepID=UPI00040F6BC5|nr:hypothetical protein [Azohydromonas australica]
MSGFDSSPNAFSFTSTFAGIPVVIEYQAEVNEDHRGQDVVIIPTACVIGDHAVDLCEDAGFFHPEQLKKWLAQAEADHEKAGEDDSEPDDYADPWAASVAEDRWIGERERIHHARAGY